MTEHISLLRNAYRLIITSMHAIQGVGTIYMYVYVLAIYIHDHNQNKY